MTAASLRDVDAHHLRRRSIASHFAEGGAAGCFHAILLRHSGDGHGLLAFRHCLDWIDPARWRHGARAQQAVAKVAMDCRRGRSSGASGAADSGGCEAPGLRQLRRARPDNHGRESGKTGNSGEAIRNFISKNLKPGRAAVQSSGSLLLGFGTIAGLPRFPGALCPKGRPQMAPAHVPNPASWGLFCALVKADQISGSSARGATFFFAPRRLSRRLDGLFFREAAFVGSCHPASSGSAMSQPSRDGRIASLQVKTHALAGYLSFGGPSAARLRLGQGR